MAGASDERVISLPALYFYGLLSAVGIGGGGAGSALVGAYGDTDCPALNSDATRAWELANENRLAIIEINRYLDGLKTSRYTAERARDDWNDQRSRDERQDREILDQR